MSIKYSSKSEMIKYQGVRKDYIDWLDSEIMSSLQLSPEDMIKVPHFFDQAYDYNIYHADYAKGEIRAKKYRDPSARKIYSGHILFEDVGKALKAREAYYKEHLPKLSAQFKQAVPEISFDDTRGKISTSPYYQNYLACQIMFRRYQNELLRIATEFSIQALKKNPTLKASFNERNTLSLLNKETDVQLIREGEAPIPGKINLTSASSVMRAWRGTIQESTKAIATLEAEQLKHLDRLSEKELALEKYDQNCFQDLQKLDAIFHKGNTPLSEKVTAQTASLETITLAIKNILESYRKAILVSLKEKVLAINPNYKVSLQSLDTFKPTMLQKLLKKHQCADFNRASKELSENKSMLSYFEGLADGHKKLAGVIEASSLPELSKTILKNNLDSYAQIRNQQSDDLLLLHQKQKEHEKTKQNLQKKQSAVSAAFTSAVTAVQERIQQNDLLLTQHKAITQTILYCSDGEMSGTQSVPLFTEVKQFLERKKASLHAQSQRGMPHEKSQRYTTLAQGYQQPAQHSHPDDSFDSFYLLLLLTMASSDPQDAGNTFNPTETGALFDDPNLGLGLLDDTSVAGIDSWTADNNNTDASSYTDNSSYDTGSSSDTGFGGGGSNSGYE